MIATKEVADPVMRDYVKEWLRLELDGPVKEFKSQIDLQEIEALIADSFISEKRRNAFTRLIKRRLEELNDATKNL